MIALRFIGSLALDALHVLIWCLGVVAFAAALKGLELLLS